MKQFIVVCQAVVIGLVLVVYFVSLITFRQHVDGFFYRLSHLNERNSSSSIDNNVTLTVTIIDESQLPICRRATIMYADDPAYGFGSTMINVISFSTVAELEHQQVFWNDERFSFGRFSDFFVPFPTSQYECNYREHELVTTDEMLNQDNLFSLSGRKYQKIESECQKCKAPQLSDTRGWKLDMSTSPTFTGSYNNEQRWLSSKVYNQYEDSELFFKKHPWLMMEQKLIGNVDGRYPNALYFYRRRTLRKYLYPSENDVSQAIEFMKQHNLYPYGTLRFFSLHIRKGDKIINEAKYHPDDEYLDVVEKIIRIDEMLNNSWTEIENRPTVMFFSDDVHLYHPFMLKRPTWNWIPVGVPFLYEFILDKQPNVELARLAILENTNNLYTLAMQRLNDWRQRNSHIDSQQWSRLPLNERVSQIHTFFQALLVTCEASYVVMTESSNIGRLLHLARGWDLTRTISIDRYTLGT